MVDKNACTEALKTVMDPDLGKDLITLNMARDLAVDGGKVTFRLVLTTPACPMKAKMEGDARNALMAVPGVESVEIETTSEVPKARGLPGKKAIPGVKNIIAVASGKGGVGKSTISVNVAAALALSGAKVAMLDADIYGPSLPTMFGLTGEMKTNAGGKIVPRENHGVRLVSIGFAIDDEAPVIWRGPMIMKVIKEFLEEVEWGEVDYLVIDLPPGTGDAQLTLAQSIPLSGSIVVTTPQDIALIDARRGIKMFEKLNVPILGIIENMTHFICPHCNGKSEIFSSGGGRETSNRYGVPYLGGIPLDPQLREGGDKGTPLVISHPDSPQSEAISSIAGEVAARISVLRVESAALT